MPGWRGFLARIAVALVALGLVLGLGMGSESSWLHASVMDRLLRLSALVIGGAGSYFATLWLFGFRLRDFRRRSAA
jgi:putative peptidoglycan lipid II flippase